MDPDKLLTPNQLVTLEVGNDKNRYAYASRIENITESSLWVATPTERGSLVVLRPGTEVRVFFNHGRGRFFFVAEVIGHEFEPIPLLILTKPAQLVKGQRRHFLRVRATIFPVESWVIDPDPEQCRAIRIATVDISGGGIRFVGNDRLPVGTKLRLRLDLPFNCGTVEVIARVLRVEERGEAIRSRYETAATFVQIAEGDRDRICRFVLKQQLDSIKRGITPE